MATFAKISIILKTKKFSYSYKK